MSASSREAPSRSRPFAGRLGEEAADRAGDVDSRIRRATTEGVRKLSLQEIGERVADPVLVARDDRGVRDRQAERVAEQGGDREPVGDAADQAGLGEGAHEAPGGMEVVEAGGGDEHRRHAGQHRRSPAPACRARAVGCGDGPVRARLMPVE